MRLRSLNVKTKDIKVLNFKLSEAITLICEKCYFVCTMRIEDTLECCPICKKKLVNVIKELR